MLAPPLLIWAISFLIGASWPLSFHFISVLSLGTFLFFFEHKRTIFVFALLGCLIGWVHQPKAEYPTSPVEGTAIFDLKSIHKSQTPFHTSYLLKGVCKVFTTEDNIYTNMPVSLFVSRVPKTGSRWEIKGNLDEKGRLKPDTKKKFRQLDAPFSFTRWRYTQKQKVKKLVHAKFRDKKVAQFFISMTTGEKPDWLMTMEFRKVGLSHILAISGFHFALIALLIGSLLKPFLSPKLHSTALLFFLTMLLVFLGLSPSILRAYVMISLYLLGKLAHRRVDGLNLLGAALLIELLFHPSSISHLGFQLTYLATFGILTFYPLFQSLLNRAFPKRTIFLLRSMPLLDQHGYLFVRFLIGGIALNFSVQLTTLPLLFHCFGDFPLLSIPYNLILPPLLGAALLLFPFALLLPPLRFLLSWFTSYLLRLIANPPAAWEIHLSISPPSLTFLLTLLTLIAIWGLKKRGHFRENRTL